MSLESYEIIFQMSTETFSFKLLEPEKNGFSIFNLAFKILTKIQWVRYNLSQTLGAHVSPSLACLA